MHLHELRMIPKLYKDGGLFLTAEMDMIILQGTCVGGSSVLANMVMMRTPRAAIEQWTNLGAGIELRMLEPYFEEIERELEVQPAAAANVSRSSALFKAAAEQIGLSPRYMNKALGACDGCGYCNVACTIAKSAARSARTFAGRARPACRERIHTVQSARHVRMVSTALAARCAQRSSVEGR
jgi:choline dehydrogenase-like flavoprotein